MVKALDLSSNGRVVRVGSNPTPGIFINLLPLTSIKHMDCLFKCKCNYSLFNDTSRISLHCKLVPVQYREYENGVFSHADQEQSTVSSDMVTPNRPVPFIARYLGYTEDRLKFPVFKIGHYHIIVDL